MLDKCDILPDSYHFGSALGARGSDILRVGITAIVARIDAVVKFAQTIELSFMERDKPISWLSSPPAHIFSRNNASYSTLALLAP